MKRKIYDDILAWKKDRNGQCLTIKGQRQVGKTYIVEQFAKDNYVHLVKIDFSRNPEYAMAFERSIDVESIISELTIRMAYAVFEPGNTLIFLDEIQECPKARSSLKWFAQDGRYDVIASGPLLGVTNTNAKRRNSDGRVPVSPMGDEKVITMRSMDFEEYLWAIGFPVESLEKVKSKISERTPLTDSELEILSSHFRDFMIVGGMPASVKAFSKDRMFS